MDSGPHECYFDLPAREFAGQPVDSERWEPSTSEEEDSTVESSKHTGIRDRLRNQGMFDVDRAPMRPPTTWPLEGFSFFLSAGSAATWVDFMTGGLPSIRPWTTLFPLGSRVVASSGIP